jgi:acetyl-CoA synthetase/medium-chain acyl-CoA synthetase
MAVSPHNMTDYEETIRTFRLDVPEHFNFAREVIGKWAQDPDKLGMWWLAHDGRERKVTFREFAERSDKFAEILQKSGVKAGDRVLVQLPRIPQWWEVLLGCMKAGAVAVPGTVLLTPKDILYRSALSEGVAYVCDPDNAAKVDQVRSELPHLRELFVVGEPEEREGWRSYDREVDAASGHYQVVDTRSSDPCLVYFTSGTVGNPKMVLHTHASYPIGHEVTGRFWLDLRPDDLHLNLSETGWAKAAWSSFLGPWNMGAALFVQDARGKFNAPETMQLLEDYPITTFCAPPTAYRMLVLEDLSHYKTNLRHCVGAGEPLNPEVISTWQKGTGHLIRDGYGQTETILLCCNFPPLEVKPGSMGKPSPTVDVAVIDEEGNKLPYDSEGDIAVRVKPERPVGLFKEYWRNPEASAACMRGDWYVTGDRAYVDGDGYFWFVGRADDVIISAGYRIGPFEVESALVEHPAVAEAAVVAKGDPLRGTIVKAFVILAPGHEGSAALAGELQEHVKRVTAPYKYPREVEFVSELPKTISGKIRRVELRGR